MGPHVLLQPVDSLDGARASVNSRFLKFPSVTLFPAWATGYTGSCQQVAPARHPALKLAPSLPGAVPRAESRAE